ncbi:protein NYNRIN-like [Grus japonensis]|uniref:Protein NYNRIN-like n=1 Tax=Grus japonensis TaxID=30415 RepID=A0ABC9YFB2_GRUJA
MVGWCRLWIPNFGLIAKPLYAATKGLEGLLEWTAECQKGFDEIKKRLMEAPALGLPNLEKPFQLYVHERQQAALGVLTQLLGTWKRPVGYFSKQLDDVSKGWPACLRPVAATVILIEEARKLTLGQPITVFVPHAVISLLENKGHRWISPSRLAKYHAVLLEQDDITLSICTTLNPANLLPTPEQGEIQHDCLTTIEQVYSSRPDLQDTPLADFDLELYTDGSSFMSGGKRCAGYAVVTRDHVLEAEPLSHDTSAQKAELIALTRALEISTGKRANIYTDSKYAFGVAHAHGAIWKERGLLNSQGTPVKYGTEIMKLLQAVLQPKKGAIIHCRAHQKGSSNIIKGNRRADTAAKEAALRRLGVEGALIPEHHLNLTPPPEYTEKEDQLAEQLDCTKIEQGWWVTPLKQLLIPERMMEFVLKKLHQETHMGSDALVLAAKKCVIGPKMQSIADIVRKRCSICCANNPKVEKKVIEGNVK